MDFSRLSRNLYNETTSDEFTSDSSAGSGDDDDDDDDEDDDNENNEDNSDNNGAQHNRKRKSIKKNIFSTFHEECDLDDIKSKNILLKLFQRERTGYMPGGFMSKRNRTAFDKVPSRLSFCLKNIVPYCFLQCHMFMGLTACGQFLISYKVCYDENSWAANNYNFSSYYKYTLYFWIYRPHQPLGKFFKTCLFDDHGVDNLKAVSMTQWITNPRILVVHGASEHENEDSYITIVRVPKLGCLDCKKLMETEGDGSYFRSDALCIKCNLTIHTKYSTTESDPKFNPYINLISPERIIIVANGFIHMLHVELEVQNQLTNHTNQQHQQQQQQNQFLCYSTKDTIINSIQQKDDKTATDVTNQCDKKTQWLPSLNYNSSSSSSNNNNSNSNNSNSICNNNNNNNNINGNNSSNTNENGCDNNDNIVARIIADFSEFENESQMAINCNNEKLSSGFFTPDINHRNNKNYDELIFTCGSNTPTYNSSSSINGLSGKQTASNSNDTGNNSKVSLLNHSKGRRNQRIVTKSYRNGITTVDLQGNNVTESSNVESTNSDDKASAYEFSEDNEKCEKIGIFRKRRLADKKYEFSEDNSENIVPFHKSRILSQGTRTRLHRALPTSHHHPIYVSASSTQTYETTTHHHRASPSQGFRSPCGSPVGSSRFLRSPSKNNSTCSSMQQLPSCSYQQQHQQQQQQQQQQQIMTVKPLNTLSPRQLSAAIKTHFETPIVGGNMSPIAPFLSPRRESPFENKVYEVSLSAEGQEKPTCIKKLKRRYVEEDDATSVITSEEDDCIFPGYHTSLPMEVHGSCYSDMQMISNASYQKLKCPTVIITQHSFDLETFTYYVISNLCQKNNKTYDVFYDWACELVNVCPHSNSITCILMAHFTARDQLLNNSTKCLNCSRNIDCVFHRRQFECRILFTWNMEFGDWDVIDYGNMNEVPSNNNKKSIIGLNKIAKTLASELSDNINKIHNYSYNLRVLDSNIDKSKESLIDLDNCIRFYRKKPKFSSCDTLTDN